MPPRGFTNPAPKTESAREAVKSFYCELCSKGYARMNEFEAHESSYDHQHKKRLKEMKQMQRDPLASSKARKAERKADEKSGLITIKPLKLESAGGGGGGFKKGGFKNAFSGVGGDVAPVVGKGGFKKVGSGEGGVAAKIARDEGGESETDEEYERYDPGRPTGCYEGCAGRRL